MNTKNHYYLLGITTCTVLLIGLFGYWGWYHYAKTCCEPPIEILAMRDTESLSLSGNWVYFDRDVAGYSTGVVINVTHVDESVAGNFSVVWSFPNAPAARIGTGTFRGTSTGGQLARIEWEGDREDFGVAELKYDPLLGTLEWQTVTSTKTDLTMPETLTLSRNRWGEMDRVAQTAVIESAQKILTLMPKSRGAEISVEDVQVINVQAAVPYLSEDGESSGTIYLTLVDGNWVLAPQTETSDTKIPSDR